MEFQLAFGEKDKIQIVNSCKIHLPHVLDLRHLHRRVDSEFAESVAANKVSEPSAVDVLHVDVGALDYNLLEFGLLNRNAKVKGKLW
jgi:hypothetical protein